MIRVVDAAGKQLERPTLVELLEPLLEKHLGNVEVLQPLVVKMPLRGPAWLYAYVDRERGLRVQIPAGLLAELETSGATERVQASFEQRVSDLAANLRSRAGSSAQYFRRNTRTLPTIDRE